MYEYAPRDLVKLVVHQRHEFLQGRTVSPIPLREQASDFHVADIIG